MLPPAHTTSGDDHFLLPPPPPPPPPPFIFILILLVGSASSPPLRHFYNIQGTSLRLLPTALTSSFLSIATLLFLIPNLSLSPSGLALGLLHALAGPTTTSVAVLPFIAIFTALLVARQTLTPYSLNAVVLLTSAAALLALVSGPSAFWGVSLHLLCSAAQGIVLPCAELAFRKVPGRDHASLAQFLLAFAGASAAVSVAGMALDREFQELQLMSWVLVTGVTLSGSMVLVGLFGITRWCSALDAAMLMSAGLVVGEIAMAVVVGGEFGGDEMIALGLCSWGVASYACGRYRRDINSGHGDDEALISLVS